MAVMQRKPGAAPERNEDYPAHVLDGCRRGDRQALEIVLRREAPHVERLLGRLLHGGDELEDVLQTTLLEAVRAFPRFRGEASVRTWLGCIAVRMTMRHFRHGRTRAGRASLRVVDATTVPVADPAPGPDRIADARRRLASLFGHLATLSARQRVAFTLYALEGRSVAEVAAMMDASRAATKARIFLARRRLLWRAARDPALHDLLHPVGEG